MLEAASASAFESACDELGVYARISVDPNVFSKSAILKTAYWCTDQHYLFIVVNRSTGMFDVEFRLKEGDSLDKLKAACGEFWNKILDSEVRQRVLGETEVIRDTLVKKAFFEAKAQPPRTVLSDETHLAMPGQSYQDDPLCAGQQG